MSTTYKIFCFERFLHSLNRERFVVESHSLGRRWLLKCEIKSQNRILNSNISAGIILDYTWNWINVSGQYDICTKIKIMHLTWTGQGMSFPKTSSLTKLALIEKRAFLIPNEDIKSSAPFGQPYPLYTLIAGCETLKKSKKWKKLCKKKKSESFFLILKMQQQWTRLSQF